MISDNLVAIGLLMILNRSSLRNHFKEVQINKPLPGKYATQNALDIEVLY